MDVLIMVGQIILGLSIIVVVHEYGHYIAARSFGMYVEKFYLFFDAWGKKLFSVTRGGTEYGIGIIPLGGYVKISGMIDESMDNEQMKKEPEPYEFRSKPAWQRFIVMVAGVVLNFILGILIFSFMTLYYGESYIPADKLEHGIVANEIGQEIGLQTGDKIVRINGKPFKKFNELYSPDVLMSDNATITIQRDGEDSTIQIPSGFANKIATAGKSEFVQPRFAFSVARVKNNSPADKIGLQKGDSIVAVNGHESRFFDQLQDKLEANKGEEVTLTIKRDGERLKKEVTPNEKGTIGFYAGRDLPKAKKTYGLASSFTRGTERAYNSIKQNVVGLGKMFTGEIDPRKGLGGPIKIATIYGASWDWSRFWGITALLSMVIGFLNILPIPALDGGHALLTLFEIVARRPVPDNAYKVIQMIGVVILLTLMVFVFANDIFQVFIN